MQFTSNFFARSSQAEQTSASLSGLVVTPFFSQSFAAQKKTLYDFNSEDQTDPQKKLEKEESAQMKLSKKNLKYSTFEAVTSCPLLPKRCSRCLAYFNPFCHLGNFSKVRQTRCHDNICVNVQDQSNNSCLNNLYNNTNPRHGQAGDVLCVEPKIALKPLLNPTQDQNINLNRLNTKRHSKQTIPNRLNSTVQFS